MIEPSDVQMTLDVTRIARLDVRQLRHDDGLVVRFAFDDTRDKSHERNHQCRADDGEQHDAPAEPDNAGELKEYPAVG